MQELSSVRCDLFLLLYKKTVYFHRYLGVSQIVKEAKNLSANTNASVFLYAKLNLEGDLYQSVLAFSGGRLVGVTDAVCGGEGNALRLFPVQDVPIGVVVGRDIRYAGVDNFFYAGAKGVVHLTGGIFSKEDFGAYVSHARLTGGRYFGLFSDCAVYCDGKVRLLQTSALFEVDFSRVPTPGEKNLLRLSLEGE